MPGPRAYRFDQFVLDLSRQRLATSDGRALSISGRAYDVLLFLIERRERVVGKDELIHAVWPRTIVEENNLNQAISSLRRALGDSRGTPRLILTVSGRGYRFIGDAQPVVIAPDAAPHGKSRALVSVAVLPFQPLVGTSGDEALEFGIADTLINRLSLLPGVAVAPLSSVRRYAGSDASPIAAGRDLGVATVLEGHVLLRDGRVRMNARLLDVEDGTARWSGSFDAKMLDFLTVQDTLAGQLAHVLAAHLGSEERARVAQPHTRDVEAWQLYLNGRYQWSRRNFQGLQRAIECFAAAAERDPRFALPVAGLADAWAVLGVFTLLPPGDAFPKARAAAERAIALDPGIAEAHASLGHVLTQYDHDWSGGERLYRHALSLKPNYPLARLWLANSSLMQGRHAEALREGLQSQALEPDSVIYAANSSMIRYHLRDHDTARAQLTALVESTPEAFLPRRYLARLHAVSGDGEAALALLDGLPAGGPGALSDKGRALAAAGRLEAARAEIARLEELGRHGFGVGYDIALVQAALGEREAALAALERAPQDLSQMVGFLNCEPGLDLLRDDARVREVSRALGLG